MESNDVSMETHDARVCSQCRKPLTGLTLFCSPQCQARFDGPETESFFSGRNLLAGAAAVFALLFPFSHK